MQKIVHIITRLDMGGSAQNTISTCAGLASRGYDVVLISGLSKESAMTVAEKETVHKKVLDAKKKGVRMMYLPALVRRISPFQDMAAFIALLRLIRRERPSVVHTHSSKAGLLGRLAAWLANIQYIVHTPHGHVFYGHFSKAAATIFLYIERAADKITDCTIALTRGERDDYVRLAVTRSAKLEVIHSGVNVDRFMTTGSEPNDRPAALEAVNPSIVVGTVGWLLPIKGPVYLLEAMQKVWETAPAAKLLFVGKGALEQDLKRRAAEMGAGDRVLFFGWRSDIPEIMQLFDIFALPSLNEGMGRVIVEAMAAGKPVVASNTGGIPDLVADGETGFLVDPGDAPGLAKAIVKLLENPGLRYAMGRAGRQRCHCFSEALMIQKIDELYERLLN